MCGMELIQLKWSLNIYVWLLRPANCTNLGTEVPILSFCRFPTMLNLKWVQPEAKPLPDTLLLALDDNSMWPRAPLQPEAKPLPDAQLLALNVELKQERAPVPDQWTRHFRKLFNSLHEKLCLLWQDEATRVIRCVVPIKFLHYPMCKRLLPSEKTWPFYPQ